MSSSPGENNDHVQDQLTLDLNENTTRREIVDTEAVRRAFIRQEDTRLRTKITGATFEGRAPRTITAESPNREVAVRRAAPPNTPAPEQRVRSAKCYDHVRRNKGQNNTCTPMDSSSFTVGDSKEGLDLETMVDEMNLPPLHRAGLGRQEKTVRQLLQGGDTVDTCDDHGFTALHYASREG